MAKAIFVKAAQKDIYQNGKMVEYESKKGKRIGQTLSRLDKTVPRDENDPIFIAKGESYYHWAFQYGGKHYSKTQPKPSQLTQSNYLSQLYTIQETIADIEPGGNDDIDSIIRDTVSDLENLKDECENSLSNMPESLQSSPTGELLQERIDALDNAISELESIDVNYDEPDDEDLREQLKDDVDDSLVEVPEEGDEDFEEFDEDKVRMALVSDEMLEEKKQELMQEWVDEKVSEIQNVSFE
jgi:hypothetical protein